MATKKPRINDEIRAKEIRVIDADSSQCGVVTVAEGLRIANDRGLDLVEIAPQAVPPVCKVIDYGKYVYEQQKRDKIQKKKQHVTVLKEIRLHPNTDTHDLEFKARHATSFLEEGNKVKVSVIFKGRELAYTEHGRNLLQKFLDSLQEVAKIESSIKFEGRAMHAILAPTKIVKKKNK